MSPAARTRDVLTHPSVARIAAIARALGELSTDVVFAGGSIVPLLQTHRWRAADGTAFTLIPVSDQPSDSAREVDRYVIESAGTMRIEPGLSIRHATAPALLAMKWMAFHDRGAADPFASHDRCEHASRRS